MREQIQGLTDVHCHILPYVDDGARNMDEAVALIRMQIEQGVSDIFLTPHARREMFETPAEEILRRFADFQKVVREIPNAPNLYLGQEFHCDFGLKERLRDEHFPNNMPILLGRRNAMLIEFSDRHSEEEIFRYIEAVKQKGVLPIVAHVERLELTETDLQLPENMIRRGAWLQMNAESVLGELGGRCKKQALRLLKAQMIHLIGSDVHRTDVRMPNLGDCAAFLRRKMSKEAFEKLFYENPSCLK